MPQNICRIAIFYDGTYFSKVYDYYMYHHERKARISITGLHEFIRHKVWEAESIEKTAAKLWTHPTFAVV